MTIVTKQFLRVHWDQKKPLLLGYSGGPDSKALLYALLECGVRPHVAHVDHAWREQSGLEALQIQEEINQLGLPFFSTRLNLKEKSEDEARRGRYAFFSDIFSPHAALLLAHQAEDLAETVLKRIFEGAHLEHLGGMQEVSFQGTMVLWRPFLRVRKEEILQFLSQRSLKAFSDPSNWDPAYLRSRIRQNLFPMLNEHFGKEIRENLCLLSQRSFEMKEYLDARTRHVPIQRGPWGTLIDLKGLASIEQRHLIQKIVPLNRDQLHTLIQWLKTEEKSGVLELKTQKIVVDKSRIWIF